MVRYRKEHHFETHKAIVLAASRQLRSRGADGVNIAEVMKSVGLTHGGFYAHFADRSVMIREALQSAMDDSAANFRKLTEMALKANRHSIIAEYYLSDARVFDRENGCPAAALASEIHRLNEGARLIFNNGFEVVVSILSDYFRDPLIANAAISQLIGSLNLMRTTSDTKLRIQIKEATLLQFDHYRPRNIMAAP